ncbi:N-formylglutamate amidohydrolase [Sphingomonas profundi]|uniref:N-formylglutamate amidohydrolase n=1 Tax=Alterirhizorhabdus profundi TaxID=2681549 RepID=UPI0012E6F2F3|nr:N-formylglutamate amidohydrolase [Sphingomonas profundi]
MNNPGTNATSPAATAIGGLLASGDPPPVGIVNSGGRSPFLLTGDHAGVAVPRALGRLGIDEADHARHIACDIGVRALGDRLSALLDATFVHQIYSRLVIDCNRRPDAADAIPAMSDGTAIPANAMLSAADRAARVAAIHAPYQDAIAATIDARQARGQATILVALHSFTPVMAGSARPWEIGILHDGGDPSFARATLAALIAQGGFVVGDNEPYRMDGTDHSVPRHAYPRGLPYVEVEFRQDRLAAPGGVALWADRFADALLAAVQGRRPIGEAPASGPMP